MKYLYLFCLAFFFVGSTNAQGTFIKGKVLDNDNAPLPGAHVTLMRLSDMETTTTVTEPSGDFMLMNVYRGKYLLKITFVGYEEHEKEVDVAFQTVNLGKIRLEAEAVNLNQVQVRDKAPMASQKGDTTEFNAQAFKTLPDANAEQLVEKMPTVVIQDGKIQAQGEDVKKVTVDGRPFFGNDPNAALKNLPAEVVDKIQIFDQKSDQAQFTGFDDGETTKTMNIVTKRNFRQGQFGKTYAGYGYDNKYKAGGNFSIFNGDQRISLIGLTNNVNIQNFSTDDLLGVVSSGRRGRGGRGRGGSRGGRGPGGGSSGGSVGDFLVPQQGGIATTHALGLNYSDKWGEKLNVTGSYFFNWSDTDSDEFIDREYIDLEDVSEFYTEESLTSTKNINHRFNGKLEYKIDSANSILMRPRLTIQQNDGYSDTYGQTMLGESTLLNQTDNLFSSDLSAVDFSNTLLWRHKFKKSRRTFSTYLTTGYNNKKGESLLQSEDSYYSGAPVSDTLNQLSNLDVNGWNVSSSFAYTEPLGKSGMLMLNYRISFKQEESDRETMDFFEGTQDYTQLNEQLSNVFSNNYITHRGGAGYNFRKGDMFVMARANLQHAKLLSEETFPQMNDISHTFVGVLPFVMVRYNISKLKNLRIFYRTNTQLPSIDQLQNVVDNTNPLQVTVGNPHLEQSYQHNLFMRYSNTNPEKSTVFFALIGGGYTSNYIANSTYLSANRNLIFDEFELQEGAQITRPENLDGYWSARSFMTFGLPLNKIKSNLNMNLSGNYSRIPGFVNERLNYSNNYNSGIGLVLSSNISDKVDFTISSQSNYNLVKNSLRTTSNTKYFSQNSKIRLDWIFVKGLVFRTSMAHQFYDGLSEDIDQSYWLWGIGLGKKLFKNQRGELTLSVYDALDQNQNIQRNVTEVYIEDVKTQALQRYVMLAFTYNFRNFRVGKASPQNQERRRGPGDWMHR